MGNVFDNGDVFTVSASDLTALAARLAEIDAAQLARTESEGHGPATIAMAAVGEDDLARVLGAVNKAGLGAAARDFREKQGAFVVVEGVERPQIAMLFSGQGSQYAGMMAAFAEHVPAADDVLRRVDAWLDSKRRARLSPVIRDAAPVPFEIFSVQALVLTADLMAFEAMRASGIAPDVVTGHSYGDYAALVAAGAWSLEDALEATAMRAKAIERNVVEGGMMSVTASVAEVERAIAELDDVETANINAPDQIVVAGTLDGLAKAEEALSAFEVRRLDVPGPFHSSHMGAASRALEEGLAAIPLTAPSTPYLSSVTQRFEEDPNTIRASLVAQLTKPVRFVEQIEALVARGIDVFVECGPRAVLTGLTKRTAPAKALAVSVDDKNRPGRWSIARARAAVTAFASAEASTNDSRIELLAGAAADRLLKEDGFDQFWEKTRPSLITFLENMWAAEKRYSQLPAPAAEDVPTASPAPIAESEIESAPIASFESAIAEPAPIASDLPGRAEVQAFLLDAICEQSGYPPDIIELDADLEADLGIDTVKQAQVLGKVRDRFDLRTDEKLSLRDFPTLGHVLDYVDGQLSTLRAAPKPSTPKIDVPMVDLSARRSQRPKETKPAASNGIATRGAREPRARSEKTEGGGQDQDPAPAAPSEAPRSERRPAASDASVTLAGTTALRSVSTEAPIPVLVDRPPITVGSMTIPAPRSILPPNSPRPVTVLHLEGTARSIGQQHGEAMRDPILEVLDRYQAFLGLDGMSMLALPDTTRRLFDVFDEASLEELRGVAEAVGVHELVLLGYNLDAALFPSLTTGCTQGVRLARHNDGALVHCINEDSPLLLHLDGVHPRVVQVRRRTDGPRPERTTVLFSLAGQIAGPNGVADNGLSVTSTTLLDGPDPTSLPTGLPHPMITKQIVEGADTIEDAVAIVERAHKAGRWSILLSDASADRAHYLEYDEDEIIAREELDSQLATTNHSLNGEAPEGKTPDHSAFRERRACMLFDEAQPLTVPRAKAILRDRHDVGRQRDVLHPTMNTVRRVDNVMSLIIEPAARRVHFTDRVLPPGSPDEHTIGFETLTYGRAPERPERIVERAEQLTSTGAGIVDLPEVMRRHVVRVVEAPRPIPTKRFTPRTALVVGEGPVADAIASALRARGAEVRVVGDPRAALLERVTDFDTLGLVLSPETSPAWTLSPDEWEERRERTLAGPFRLLRAWAPQRESGVLFGVTTLGGALGFDNAAQGTGDGGGLLGLLKATRREFDSLRVQALDVSPSEPPAQVADALLAELDADDRLEVGLLRGKRLTLAMAERRPNLDAATNALPAHWLVTGGARGVTAKMAIRIAELYQPRLVLLGRHELPEASKIAAWRALDEAGLAALKDDLLKRMRAEPGFSPLAWKAACESIDKTLEVDATLRAIAERGAKVEYHAVDLRDRQRLATVLEAVRARGPIEGLLHGAGDETAKPFDKKSDELFERTVGGKVDGLVHLFGATQRDAISHVVAFSSVSGRFGGHGQTDYSLANEAQARILGAYRARHPDRRVTAIAWAAFSEVGLAARSSAKAFLEKAGQAFMTPAEGANHLVRELWADAPEPEVTICERLEALDMDHLLVPEDERTEWLERARRASVRPLVDHLVLHDAHRTIVERDVSASEPFLDQHRMGPTPILPAVMSLELLAELAMLDGGDWSLADVVIERPYKVEATGRLCAERTGDALRVVSTARKQDGVVLEPARVFVRARRVAAERARAQIVAESAGTLVPYPYPKAIDRTPGSRMIFHGPAFRCLEGVRRGPTGGTAQLIVPAATSLVPGSSQAEWRIPAALLDGCLQAVGMLGRLVYEVVALPAGFGRVDVSRRAFEATGERVQLAVVFVDSNEDELVADFDVMSADGPLLSVRGYRAQVVPST